MQLTIWMRQRGFSAWGIQTGPFAAHRAHFLLEHLNFFTFILEGQFLLPQRANNGSWENFPFPNMDETEGCQCLGPSNRTICSPLSQFCSGKFPTFSLSYWEVNSYYPRGPIMGKGNSPNFQLDDTEDFKCLGLSNWTICSPLHLSLFEN